MIKRREITKIKGRKPNQFRRKLKAKGKQSAPAIIKDFENPSAIINNELIEENLIPNVEISDDPLTNGLDDRLNIRIPSTIKRFRTPAELRKSLLREFPIEQIGISGMINLDSLTNTYFIRQGLLEDIQVNGASGKRITLLNSLNSSIKSLLKELGNSVQRTDGTYKSEELPAEETEKRIKELDQILGPQISGEIDRLVIEAAKAGKRLDPDEVHKHLEEKFPGDVGNGEFIVIACRKCGNRFATENLYFEHFGFSKEKNCIDPVQLGMAKDSRGIWCKPGEEDISNKDPFPGSLNGSGRDFSDEDGLEDG